MNFLIGPGLKLKRNTHHNFPLFSPKYKSKSKKLLFNQLIPNHIIPEFDNYISPDFSPFLETNDVFLSYRILYSYHLKSIKIHYYLWLNLSRTCLKSFTLLLLGNAPWTLDRKYHQYSRKLIDTVRKLRKTKQGNKTLPFHRVILSCSFWMSLIYRPRYPKSSCRTSPSSIASDCFSYHA